MRANTSACSALQKGRFGVNGILMDVVCLWLREKIGVEVGFGVSRLSEAPANRQSASLSSGWIKSMSG